MLKRKIAPAAVALAVAAGGTAIPAVAASHSTTHWSSKKCAAYVKSFKKSHKHATSKQIKAANKVLKKHGCSNKA